MAARNGILTCSMLCILLLLWLTAARAESTVPSVPALQNARPAMQRVQPGGMVETAKPAKKRRSPDVQGFRLGMSISTVRRLLNGKGITNYDTAFSDLFVYSLMPGAEVRLQFTCGTGEGTLSNVTAAAVFPAAELDLAAASYPDKLIEKYGPPVRSESGPDGINMCWGACGQEDGWMLEALTKPAGQGDVQFVVVLGDQSLARACGRQRTGKIDRWLNQWVRDIRDFQAGMSLKEASFYYQKRYDDRLVAGEEHLDPESGGIRSFVVRDQDYFAGLDSGSVNFEGEEPGTIVMKFTGDQADPRCRLNQRLYYALFTTTAFTKAGPFPDLQKKLDALGARYGKPAEVRQEPDGITARWQEESAEVKAGIFVSGLIKLELSAPGINDAYREAAARRLEELKNARFTLPFSDLPAFSGKCPSFSLPHARKRAVRTGRSLPLFFCH